MDASRVVRKNDRSGRRRGRVNASRYLHESPINGAEFRVVARKTERKVDVEPGSGASSAGERETFTPRAGAAITPRRSLARPR